MSDLVFDHRQCALGEGPLWHPERQQLFWFDIINKKMLSQTGDHPHAWQFDQHVSAAGWINADELLIASETELFRFNIETSGRAHVCALEADEPETRSNDGRADPWGGFWIGTMGKQLEPEAGAIYRYYKGAVEVLYQDITIPNAICFSPDRQYAYFTDTPTKLIMRQALETDGWPTGSAEVIIDLNADGTNPDGAVIDAEGCIWIALWGASRIARFSPNGALLSTVSLDAQQITCPSIGGTDLSTLFATSATQGLTAPNDVEGKTFNLMLSGIKGQPEHRVVL